MLLKTFRASSSELEFAILEIERQFNTWAEENRNSRVIKTHFCPHERTVGYTKVHDAILLMFYSLPG